MKLAEFDNLTTQSNFEPERINYNLAKNGKIFDIIFNHVYTDKIGAVLREIGANAQDAHVVAGIDKPIEIILPNVDMPTIRIRDFGSGLSKEEMKDIYINKGASLSSQSNKTIGCYGIGAGSIFCYANSFITHSYYKGKKYTYIHTRDESGIPHANFIGESDTEETGFEVEISCKPSNIEEFKIKSRSLFMWFDPQPKIIPELDLDRKISYEDDHCIISENISGAAVLMGGITYRLSNTSVFGFDYTNISFKLLNKNILIKVNIGEVDVDAGRENLQYTDRTKAFIKDKCLKIIEEMKNNLEKRINGAKNLYEANLIFNDVRNTAPIHINKVKYKDKEVNGEIRIINEIVPFVDEDYQKSLRAEYKINLFRNIVFAENDIKRCQYRSGKNLIQKLSKQRVYYLNGETQKLKQWLKDSGAEILKLSDYYIPPNKGVKRERKGVIKEKVFKYNFGGKTGLGGLMDGEHWEKTELDLTKGGVYTIINRYRVCRGKNYYIEESSSFINHLNEAAKTVGIDFPTEIYGVKRIIKDKFIKNEKWENYFDVISKLIDKFIKKNKDFIKSYNDYSHYENSCLTNFRTEDLIGQNYGGDLGDFLNRIKKIQDIKPKLQAFDILLRRTGKTLENTSDFNTCLTIIDSKYRIIDIIKDEERAINFLLKRLIKLEGK